MRLLRALTLVLLMLHLLPNATMRPAADGRHSDGEQCGHAAMQHDETSDSCGASRVASCCEHDPTTIGSAAIVLDADGVLAGAHAVPTGPRTLALTRSKVPATPPPKA